MSCDSASIGSKGSKNSKKRTIDGSAVGVGGNRLASAYSFRRTDSNSSSASTHTAGNNTSGETNLNEQSPSKGGHSDEPSLNMGALSFDDADHNNNSNSNNNELQQRQKPKKYHRRDFSAASTTSSLSVGGFSLGSYEGPRGKDRILVLLALVSFDSNSQNGAFFHLQSVLQRIT
jgi:hypothetical protein